MPVYEYQCGDCNKRFDLFVPQRMNTDGVVCRACHGSNVRKLISTFASVGAASEASSYTEAPANTGGGCCGGACGCGGH